MADYKERLADYVQVNERLIAFYEKFPMGSLQSKIIQHTDKLVVVQAHAYRWPHDDLPGIGHSSMEIPGKTTFTRGSELENAETSAWGRALAALGFEVKRGVATQDEIDNKHDPLDDTGDSKDLDAALPVAKPFCPNCKNPEFFIKRRPPETGYFCWKNEKREKFGCGANFTDEQYEAAKPKPDDKDIEWDGPGLDTSTSQEHSAGDAVDGPQRPLTDELAPTPTLPPKGRQKADKGLSSEQVGQLARACESAGVDPYEMLGWFGVKAFENMTVGQYAQALKELLSRRAKGAEL